MPTTTSLSTSKDATALREGVIAGLLGAATVALFYLGADIFQGRALTTPSVLGEVFILHNPDPSSLTPNLAAVLYYTGFHLIAFIAFGLFLSALIRASETSGLARYATVQLLVVFELFFYGILSIASETVRGLFPLWSVLAANTLAVVIMGWWLWRHHPAVRAALLHSPLGAEEGG